MNKRLIGEEAMRNMLGFLNNHNESPQRIFSNVNAPCDSPTPQGITQGEELQIRLAEIPKVTCIDKSRLEEIVRIIANPRDPSIPITREMFVTAEEYECLMLYWGVICDKANKALALLRREEELLSNAQK